MANQGPKFGSTFYSGGGSNVKTWTNPNNIGLNDGQKATVTFTSLLGTTLGGMPWLAASNFGFNIPSNATITGVSATVKQQLTGGLVGVVVFNDVFLTKVANTPTGNSKGTNVAVSTSEENRLYGGDGDLWGNTLTPADVNSSGFGIAIRCISTDVLANRTVNVDSITLTIFYKVNVSINTDVTNFIQTNMSSSTLMEFVKPTKTVVAGDALDMTVWDPLPTNTMLYVETRYDTDPNTIDYGHQELSEGKFEATFNPSGMYQMTLKAPGFQDQTTMITVTYVPDEPIDPNQ